MDRAITLASGVFSALGVVVGIRATSPVVQDVAFGAAVIFGLLCLVLLFKQGVDAMASKRKKKFLNVPRTRSASKPTPNPEPPYRSQGRADATLRNIHLNDIAEDGIVVEGMTLDADEIHMSKIGGRGLAMTGKTSKLPSAEEPAKPSQPVSPRVVAGQETGLLINMGGGPVGRSFGPFVCSNCHGKVGLTTEFVQPGAPIKCPYCHAVQE